MMHYLNSLEIQQCFLKNNNTHKKEKGGGGGTASALVQLLRRLNLIEKLSECKSSRVLGNLRRGAEERRMRQTVGKQDTHASSYSLKHTLKTTDGRLVTDRLQFQRKLRSVCSRAERKGTLPTRSRCSQIEVSVTEAQRVCALLQGYADLSGSAPA